MRPLPLAAFALSLSLSLFLLLNIGCGSRVRPNITTATSTPQDPYLWLEDSKSSQTQKWIREHNAKTAGQIEADPLFKELADKIRKIMGSTDRIPMPTLASNSIRNFWDDPQHVRGLWRQTTPEEYQKPHPQWTTILDIDALNKQEGKSWVFRGAICLPPLYDRCLLRLSDGGKDETTTREFIVSEKKFVPDGFILEAAKSKIDWVDENTVVLSTNFGADSLTASGYARIVKVWKRGTPLSAAKTIFEGRKEDVSSSAFHIFRPEGSALFIDQGETFFENSIFLVDPKSLTTTRLPFPKTAEFLGLFKGQILYRLKQDWDRQGKILKASTIVSLPLESVQADPNTAAPIDIVYSLDSQSAFDSMSFTKDFAILNVLRNVRSELLQVEHTPKGWKTKPLALPRDGNLWIAALDPFDPQNRVYAGYETFLKPSSLYLGALGTAAQTKWRVTKKLPDQFDSRNLVTEQFHAISKDGTKIPYFFVHPKSMVFNGKLPTLMTAYGGFEISYTPEYMGPLGKVWLEAAHGGYVVANIRGGGEFGPEWHKAAIKEKRQTAYDDFAAVTADLFRRKITSPAKLGIMGGSNGGLLMGAAMTQNPHSYGAIVCAAPLLDMLRYTLLPPGASWIGEYGDPINPADPEMRAAIAKYSPYQNLKSDVKYPKIFFYTSTADDRVHPGHARKMAAQMENMHNDILYFENTEGGHSGSADLEQRIKKLTLKVVYLYQQLMNAP